MKRLPFLLFAALCFGLAACAPIEEEEVLPPRISLSDLRFLKGGAFEQPVEVDLRVSNPNNFDINLEGLTFELEINESHFADGNSNQDVTLPRLGDAKVPVTATTTLVDLIRQALLFGESGEVRFRLEGFAYVSTGFGSRRVPIESEGSLKLLPHKREDGREDRRYVPIRTPFRPGEDTWDRVL